MYKGSQTNKPELNRRYKSTNEIDVIDVSRRLNSETILTSESPPLTRITFFEKTINKIHFH